MTFAPIGKQKTLYDHSAEAKCYSLRPFDTASHLKSNQVAGRVREHHRTLKTISESTV
jgi:hypothetical protein